jgi:hypothetical protein
MCVDICERRLFKCELTTFRKDKLPKEVYTSSVSLFLVCGITDMFESLSI